MNNISSKKGTIQFDRIGNERNKRARERKKKKKEKEGGKDIGRVVREGEKNQTTKKCA